MVCISGAATLAWMIYASIEVWGDVGSKCEDVMPKSYKFIKVWLIILYCCLGLLCCLACMMAFIVNNNRKKAKKQLQSMDDTPLRS